MKHAYHLMALFLCILFQKSIASNWSVPPHSKAFLGGELSATASRLGIFVVPIDEKKPRLIKTFEKPATKEVDDVITFIRDVLAESKQQDIQITDACFTAAGFPYERTLMSTHTKVKINADDVKEMFGLNRVEVLNDFELAAYAIDTVPPEMIQTLHPGDEKGASQKHLPRIIIGASTGLGFCIMAWDTATQAYKTVGPAWGGGVEFSANSIEDLDIQEHILNAMNAAGLQKKATRWGGMLSSNHPSAGLRQIYQFYKNKSEGTTEYTPNNLPTREYIVQNRANDPYCKKAVEKYMELYARCIRNLASATLPFGGIYIAGEFAALYPELFTHDFVKTAFFNLDGLAQMNGLERLPVHVLTCPNLTLLGTAQYLALTA